MVGSNRENRLRSLARFTFKFVSRYRNRDQPERRGQPEGRRGEDAKLSIFERLKSLRVREGTRDAAAEVKGKRQSSFYMLMTSSEAFRSLNVKPFARR